MIIQHVNTSRSCYMKPIFTSQLRNQIHVYLIFMQFKDKHVCYLDLKNEILYVDI